MSHHHPFSPSSLGRRRLCPGSFQVEQGTPKSEEEFAAAKEGTMLHSMIAYQLVERKAQPAVADPCYLLESLSVEQRNTVMDCMSWLDDIIEENSLEPETNKYHYDIQVEKPLEWKDGDKVVCAGTADVIIIPNTPPLEEAPDRAIIVDWKFGRAAIEHANATLQILGYGVLLFENNSAIENITAYIYQPRVGEIYQTDLRREHLDIYKENITSTIEACQVKDPVLAPSTAACNYCRGIALCPAVEDMSKEVIESVGQGLTADPEEAVSALLAHKTAEELGEIYSRSKVVMQYAKAVKDFCKQSLLVADGSVEGWNLQKRKGKKKLTDNLEAVELLGVPASAVLRHGTLRLSKLAELLHSPIIARDDLLRLAEISVSGLEKEFIEQECEANETTKAAERKEFNKRLAPVIEIGDSVNAIVKKKKKGSR